MGASLQPGGRGRRKPPMSEINVTPLVDVMLVLLIIFMVTAPLLVAGVPVDLPNAKSPSLPQENDPVQLSIDEQRRIFINEEEVALSGLPDKLMLLTRGQSEPRVYVRADRTLDYGLVMQVVGEVNAAGFKKVALVSTGSSQADADEGR
jgi:biopolymer transport protein TolR